MRMENLVVVLQVGPATGPVAQWLLLEKQIIHRMNISHAQLFLFVFFISFYYRDDDDINDVASMAGVNLNEESAQIMATNSDLVGTQIQSCKDEPFLAAIPLHKRILEMGEKHVLSFW